MNGRIFINYRREDDQAAAGRLYDRLLQHFDREQLFMDIEAIEPGVDFVKSLDEQVAACIAFIAVIGPRWLNARNNDGNPRLDNPTFAPPRVTNRLRCIKKWILVTDITSMSEFL